jgi:hypothetical protein
MNNILTTGVFNDASTRKRCYSTGAAAEDL